MDDGLVDGWIGGLMMDWWMDDWWMMDWWMDGLVD